MNKNNQVFAISNGDYSDFSIIAIFSTRKKARDYIKYVHNNDPNKDSPYPLTRTMRIHPYTLDSEWPLVRDKMLYFNICMDYRTGDIKTYTERIEEEVKEDGMTIDDFFDLTPKTVILDETKVVEKQSITSTALSYGRPNYYYTLWDCDKNEWNEFSINVMAKDKETAIKIASDVRRQVFAEHGISSKQIQGFF